MSTLLLRLAAPMQAWGLDCKFDTRRTAREPTKSGVVGLAAAALGIRRGDDDALARLSAMRFGVRVDQEGAMVRDYHTAKREGIAAYVTQRYYLADAVFVAGLESDDEAMLEEIAEALNHPAFPLFLGRRACPPTGAIGLGIVSAELEHALRAAPIQTNRRLAAPLRMVTEARHSASGGVVRDVPVSFSPERRQYAFRRVVETSFHPDVGDAIHDPMAELE